jgi:hypothetical protein
MPDPSFATFVTKILKRKTRKDKDYFVLRATIPKSIIEEVNAEPGDFLFFKVKKAEWYHMLDWENMENTWQMLPDNVKYALIRDGIPYPGTPDQFPIAQQEPYILGATNPAGAYLPKIEQIQTYEET